MRKRVLLAGSSFSASPIFFRLKQLGLQVGVVGRDTGDPCHEYADFSCPVDYSITDNLLAAAQACDADFVCPSCNDYSYLSCASVAWKLGYPGFDSPEVTETLHFKDAFREFCRKHGIESPAYQRIQHESSIEPGELRFPLLLKPVDSFSGRGISVIESEASLGDALERCVQVSRLGSSVIEELVPGTLHSHCAFIKEQQVHVDTFADEFCSVYPYQVDCSNIPSVLGERVRSKVRDAIEKIASILKICDGLLHTQFICDGDEIWIIECMRRAPGDLYFEMVRQSSGVDFFDLFIRPFVGADIPDLPKVVAEENIARHTISTRTDKIAQGFSISVPGAEVREIVPLKGSGATVRPAPYDKLGIVFLGFENRQALWDTAPNIANYVSLVTHKGT